MITLFYIKGLTETDTLKFNTIQEQETYFFSKPHDSIDYSYYPPHYQDTIKIDSPKLKYSNNYNYACIDYDNKKYYYFITKPYYINDDLISLSLTMDTIQTYYFDIDFNYSYIDRNTIPRWINNNINRDYIRENISKTSHKLKTTQYMPNDYILGYLIINSVESVYNDWLASTDWNNRTGSYTKTMIYDNRLTDISGCISVALPIFNKNVIQRVVFRKQGETDITPTFEDHSLTLISFITDPYIQNISYTPFCELDNHLQYEKVGSTLYIDYSDAILYKHIRRYGTGSSATEVSFHFPLIKCDKIDFNETRYYRATFTKNNSINTSFNIKFCPQLLDSNYMQLKYGEKMFETTYPVEYSKTTLFHLIKSYDYDSNRRLYYMKSDYDEYDKYKTMVQNTSYENIFLANDSYQQFYANNYSSLTRGVNLQNFNAMEKFGLGVVNNIGKTTENLYGVGSAMSNQSFNHNISGYRIANTGIQGTTSNSMSFGRGLYNDARNLYIDTHNINENLAIMKENAESAPDSTKIGNNVNLDILSNNLMEIFEIYEVEDIENVARRFEYFGYKIDKFTTNNLLTNQLYYPRYYYNYISTNEIDITVDKLVGIDIMNDIKLRFKNGLRFWNNQYDIGSTIEYDNIEISEIQNNE